MEVFYRGANAAAPGRQAALWSVGVTICNHPLIRRSRIMAGQMKKTRSCLLGGANYALLVVLLAVLPQASRQNPGKEGASALTDEFDSRRVVS